MSKGGAQQTDLTEQPGKPAKAKEGGSGFKGLFSRFSGGKSAAASGHKYSPASGGDPAPMGNGSSRHGSGHSNTAGANDAVNGTTHSQSGQSFNSLSPPSARIKIGDKMMEMSEIAQLIPQLEEKLRQKEATIEEKESVIRKQKSVVDEQFQKIQSLEEEIVTLKVSGQNL